MSSPKLYSTGHTLGKRKWDNCDLNTPSPVTKKRREGTASTSYPTPESTQISSTDSSSEESGRSCSRNKDLVFWALSSVGRTADIQPKTSAANAARIEFLADISNYIPLGTLTLPLDNGEAVNLHETEWVETNIEHRLSLTFRDYHSAIDAGPVLSARKLSESGFARLSARKHQKNKGFATIRVHVLPDDVGRGILDRHAWKSNSNLRVHLDRLVSELDISFESWDGVNDIEGEKRRYGTETKDGDSLFYLFNTLPSPTSSSLPIRCPVSNEAVQSVTSASHLPGLCTPLYPYQKRTVAKMIQREVEPEHAPDPRFQQLKGPTGQTFFYDQIASVLLRDGRTYEEVRGGILGESMGLGKTLICLATILATRGHWPQVPPQYSTDLHPVRRKVGSLMQMAAAAAGRNQIPWRALLQDASQAGEDHQNLAAMLEANVGSYVIPPPEAKYSRRLSVISKGKTIRLSTGTLVIVPQNLMSQWKKEISTHVEYGRLQILFVEADGEIPVPPAHELLWYDLILMSKTRFEKEMIPGENKKRKQRGGCLCSLDEDCQCSRSDDYQTPLKEIHWLRIIMDEGHEFSSSGKSGTAYWALRDLCVDRKWIVSGTPVNGLLGVEVETATNETSERSATSCKISNRDLLEIRRKESALSQERKDLEKLGILVTGFLQVKPWANSKEDDPASWQKYIMPHQDGQRKASSLKKLLESLVVRHRIEDIEADIKLPSLHNRVVYLQPSWHDKLSINLFLLNLTANAVTSERVDEDYMFHPRNRRQLNILINNLRQAGFYWTSIAPEVITKTLKVCRSYLDEHQGESPGCSKEDKMLLERSMCMGELILQSTSWRSFAEFHEMGMYVVDFPESARSAWSLIPQRQSTFLLTGATQLAKAQSWVDRHLYAADPFSGLAEVGVSILQKLWQATAHESGADVPEDIDLHEQPGRSPKPKSSSNFTFVPKLTDGRTVSRAKAARISRKSGKAAVSMQNSMPIGLDKSRTQQPSLKSALKNPTAAKCPDLLPPSSPVACSRLAGTASAKLTYLLDRVAALYQDEKILIFYEGDQIAWYIAQALDLIDVRYLIYAKSLSLARQAAYIATFNATETFRVLLMNVHQAAHGLHIATASRVFFVNPVWQPNVEAQAIKRAHRIGQVRPVYVETLVLKDTLEDRMLQRRKRMTAQEHQKAEQSLLDDDIMSTIIKNADFIPLLDDEIHDESKQMAKLETSHQVFARVNRGEGDANDPDADLIFPDTMPPTRKPQQKGQRKRLFEATDEPRESSYYPIPFRSSTPATSSRHVDFAFPKTDHSPSTSQMSQSSSSASRTTSRRVGFALDAEDPSDHRPISIFGNGSL